jgi:hypothetical protein
LIHSSALTNNSQMYSRKCNIPNFYYEAIQMNVTDSGYYTLTSCSSINTYGYIYKKNFNPLSPDQNILIKDDDSSGSSQFQLRIFLQADITYVLVMTTFFPRITGEFSIYALGPKSIAVKRIGEYIYILFSRQSVECIENVRKLDLYSHSRNCLEISLLYN